MALPDIRTLHHHTVLVKSACDLGNPPTALRGTIEVHEDPSGHGTPVVQIMLGFPQMFSTRAQHRTITLDRAAIDRLLASECDGTFELMVEEPLEPAAVPSRE